MMTSLKTYLLFHAALLLLPIVPTVAEVVKVVSDCDQFLLDETPPQVPRILEGGNILNQNRYKPICQTFENVRKFVTLYDIKNRIPVFSAYKYRGDSGEKRPKNTWKIEPQLENEDDKNMMIGEKYKNYINQAGNADYCLNRRFDRGHLIPSSYMFTKKESTFALTNVVPQAKTFNQGSWNRMETCIKCVMNNYCFNNNGVIEGFVVTGAQPSTNNTLKNRINIPSILWSAFCCYSYKMEMWIASAHWSDNVPDGSKTKYLQAKTLAELHQELKIVVFPGKQCPRNETVTELYSKNKNCNCPLPISTTSASPTSTSDPHTSTSGPQTSTSGPHTSTSDRYTSTFGHYTSTSDPQTSKSGPQTSTSGRHTSTSDLYTSTSDLYTSTSDPHTSTSDPHTSTSGPQTSTSGPHTSTSDHYTSTSDLYTSTFGRYTSTSDLYTSTSGPQTSTTGPVTTTSGVST